MMKSKMILTCILAFFLSACSLSTQSSSTSEKQLDVPDINDVEILQYTYYTSAFDDGCGNREKIDSDSSVSSFYEKLKDAKYEGKLESNEVIESENVLIRIQKNDGTTRVFTIYPKDNIYYLEDNDNLELYTCDESIFTQIKTNAEINKQALKTDE